MKPFDFRAQLTDVRHEAVTIGFDAAVVDHQRRDEMQLQVGHFKARTRFQEAAGLETLLTAGARLEERVLHAGLQLLQRLGEYVERDGLGAFVLHRDVEMILQILADARQVGDDVANPSASNSRRRRCPRAATAGAC